MLSAYLPWFLGFAVLVVLPVLLRLFADDAPRNEEKPGSEDEMDPGPAAVPVAA